MIDVEGIQKAFGATVAVRNATFTARDGQITGLLGPNGAGKSTTLRVLYTALKPDSGQARIGGVEVREDPDGVRARLGVLPHGAGLYQRLTARENIEYFAQLQNVPSAEVKRRVDALIEVLDLGNIAERRAKGFSQGERTRVALARALVHEPSHVLLDEPTNGLDVMATRRLRAYIRTLRDEGRCVVLSSHIMQEVASLCDEIVIIARGEVIVQATPDALRETTGHDDLEEAFVSLVGEDAGGAS
ncbi:MAG: ATP-binding cassette domain-containing protein [Myxococcota bacterium]